MVPPAQPSAPRPPANSIHTLVYYSNNNNSDAVAALDAKQVDVLVTDTPQCVYMVQSEQVTDGVVVGQIPGTEDPDGLGIVLPLGSELTPYVTDAMNALLDDGTIDGLVQEWLKDYVEVPELTA